MKSKYSEAFIEQALVKVYSRGDRTVRSVAGQSVFALLESEIAPKVDKSTGRPGTTCGALSLTGVLQHLNND